MQCLSNEAHENDGRTKSHAAEFARPGKRRTICTENAERNRFYARVTRISCGDSVLVSWCPSRPDTVPSPGEIETSGLHHMIA